MPRLRHRSVQATALFSALLERADEWQHGYDLLQRTGLKSGTLYPLLMRLSDDTLLESKWQPAVPPARAPRHAYRLTYAGEAFALSVVAERRARLRPAKAFA